MPNKKYNQSKVYEFTPDETITPVQIIELSNLVRIGVSGEIIKEASDELKKHFTEIIINKVA